MSIKEITSKHQIQASSYDFSVHLPRGLLHRGSTGINDFPGGRGTVPFRCCLPQELHVTKGPVTPPHLEFGKSQTTRFRRFPRQTGTANRVFGGFWLVVEPTHLKNISQNGFIFPQKEAKIKQFWNHHPVLGLGFQSHFVFLFCNRLFVFIGMVRLMVVFGRWTIMEDEYNWIDG